MMRWLHDRLLRRWYGNGPVWILIPFTWVFVALTTLRRSLYRIGALLPGTLPVPVIVIGNLTVGGSGKTPCTLWLSQALSEAGHRPGIITRGYGGKSGYWPRKVTPESDPREVGDEAVLLARRSGLPVAAGPDRIAAAMRLIEEEDVDLILSDDGLQHYRLPRDVEVIMLDGTRSLGNGWRLPAGPLRESAGRLRDAEFVVIKAGDAVPAVAPDQALLMHLELAEAISLSTGERRPLTDFSGQRVHAVAGIADPGQFFAALTAHGLQVDGRALPDHAMLGPRDLAFGNQLPVLMTEKDAVKCRGMTLESYWYVPAVARFSETDKIRFLSALNQRLMKSCRPGEFHHG
ncbi:MAG: tetraacyldisaccharide 4'-kinase [Gammaproteobacteria bacterium]